MRLNDDEIKTLEHVSSVPEIVHALKSFGYEHAAGGSYSEVYTRGESAVKVNTANAREDGAMIYLEWLRDARPDNPAFPHVYHVWRKYGEDGKLATYVAEMERLEPQSSWISPTTELIFKAIHGYDIELRTPEMHAANIIRDRFLGVASFDMHSNNWMLRGAQPVITDPLAMLKI